MDLPAEVTEFKFNGEGGNFVWLVCESERARERERERERERALRVSRGFQVLAPLAYKVTHCVNNDRLTD